MVTADPMSVRISPSRLLPAAVALLLSLPTSVHGRSTIMIEGYFNRSSIGDPTVTREIHLSTDGRTTRLFGIVGAQSNVGTAATDIFQMNLRPIVLVRGRDEMIAQLDAAQPGQSVKIIGLFDARSNTITMNHVEVGEMAQEGSPAKDPAAAE